MKFFEQNFPNYRQLNKKDCGPTCIKIIARYYKVIFSIDYIRELCETTGRGTNLYYLSSAAEKLGFKTIGLKVSIDDLRSVTLPCILHWNNNHYVVLYKVKKNLFYISDPAFGLLKYDIKEFKNKWNKGDGTGIILTFQTTPSLFQTNESSEDKYDLNFLFQYLKPYKKYLFQVLLGLFVASVLQLILPFLMQSIIDVGIKNSNINFIYTIMIAQLAVFSGRTSIEAIRSWILLHISTRVNISLISDFFVKLMSLPISFFDTRLTGDLMQRINDHQRIENILTNSSISTIFSVINILIFGSVLLYYDSLIFLIYIAGSLIYLLWIFLFLKKRRVVDFLIFGEMGKEQSRVIELINGMQDIKLHNAERLKRWQWEFIQARLYQLSIKNLKIEQFQSIGATFISEVKNVVITVTAAIAVVNGDMTLGMMLAISFISGQLNAPLAQFVTFIKDFQDAKIAVERLSEIHKKEEKENTNRSRKPEVQPDIELNNVSFSYPGIDSNVLNEINLKLINSEVTAIVGSSGSGKTTILKLLLGYYEVNSGCINIGNSNIKDINISDWRKKCGVVMQEGYIFNDTIANNVAFGEEYYNVENVDYSLRIANIADFVNSLPNGIHTEIGTEGIGLSSGQKQRILIARAIYKNPEFLFFDEATSALDATNEKEIMYNLNKFFENRTVLIIAHRLSTVKNADNIVVLKKGEIVETGTHSDLIKDKTHYYSLIKDQLELGS